MEPQKVEVVSPVPIPVKVVPDDVYVPERRQTAVPPSSNIPYILAVVFMMTLGVVSIVVLVVARPSNDNTLIITTIIGFLAPTTLSLLAFMKSQETHLSVNSRLDAFMSQARVAAHSQGLTQGRTEGRASADARTDALRTGAHQ